MAHTTYAGNKDPFLHQVWLGPLSSAYTIHGYCRIYCLTFTTLWAHSEDGDFFFLIFPRKQDLTFYANCLQWRQFALNVKSSFLGKIGKKKSPSVRVLSSIREWPCHTVKMCWLVLASIIWTIRPIFLVDPCDAEKIKDTMPTSNFQPVRLLDPVCWYKFTYLITNSADPDQLVSEEANWSGSALFDKGRKYLDWAGPGSTI